MDKKGDTNLPPGMLVVLAIVAVAVVVGIAVFVVKNVELFGKIPVGSCSSQQELNRQIEAAYFILESDQLYSRYLGQFAKCYPDDETSIGLIARARKERDNRNYDEAIKLYDEFILRHSSSIYLPFVYDELGYLYGVKDQPDKAVRTYQAMYSRFSGDERFATQALISLGNVYLRYYDPPKFDLSIASFKESIEKYPNREVARALYGLGEAYEAKGDFKGALEAFKSIKDKGLTSTYVNPADDDRKINE